MHGHVFLKKHTGKNRQKRTIRAYRRMIVRFAQARENVTFSTILPRENLFRPYFSIQNSPNSTLNIMLKLFIQLYPNFTLIYSIT